MSANESITAQLSESELLRVDEHLRRKALERCGHVHDAEDLVQDTHLAAQLNANGTDHRESDKRVVNLMRGLHTSQLRRQGRSVTIAAPIIFDQAESENSDPASIAEHRELCAVLAREVEHLPHDVRIPLRMYWYGGNTYSEIAIACDLGDESAARRRCNEGIKALERRIGQRSDGKRLLSLPAWAMLAGSTGGRSGWSWKLLLRKPVVWVTALVVGVVVATLAIAVPSSENGVPALLSGSPPRSESSSGPETDATQPRAGALLGVIDPTHAGRDRHDTADVVEAGGGSVEAPVNPAIAPPGAQTSHGNRGVPSSPGGSERLVTKETYWPDGVTLKERWQEDPGVPGVYHGLYETFNADGRRAETCQYLNGLRHGLLQTFGGQDFPVYSQVYEFGKMLK